MNNYAVFLMGENFMLPGSGGKEPCGFFVTVRVEASSEEEAGPLAIQLIKTDPKLADAFKEEANETPKIEVRVVHQLLPENRMKQTEFTFFPMEEL